MGILDSITTGRRPKPPKLFIYGPGGIGKTTLAASIPGVVLMPIEEGSDTMDVPRLPKPRTFAEVREQMVALCNEPHGFSAVAFDSVTRLEGLIWQAVAQNANVDAISDIGYGKGYAAALEIWREFLAACDYLIEKRGVAIVLIGHADVKRYDNPATESYDRYQPRLHKDAWPLLHEWSDAVLFLNHRVYVDTKDVGFNKERTRAVGTGERIMHTEERPAFVAKNRYALPPELPIAWAPLAAGIAKVFAAATTTNPPAPPATTAAAPAAA